jgi:hypothetical protein
VSEVRNFDQVHPVERSFVLAGETFHWQPIWWRQFGEMVEDDVQNAEAELQAETEREKLVDEATRRGEALPPNKLKIVESYERVIRRIVAYLVPDDVERFETIVNDPEKRISMLQLQELRDWLQEASNNRPTQLPSPSEDGRGTDAPTLQAV